VVNPFFFFFFLQLLNSECFLFQVTGIANLLPGAVIDAALFDPCGYSANGLLSVSEHFSYSYKMLIKNYYNKRYMLQFWDLYIIFAVVQFYPWFKILLPSV